MAQGRNALVLCDGRIDIPDHPRRGREGLIRKCAYFKSLKRRSTPGQEMADWLAAEKEVDEWLKRSQPDLQPSDSSSGLPSAPFDRR